MIDLVLSPFVTGVTFLINVSSSIGDVKDVTTKKQDVFAIDLLFTPCYNEGDEGRRHRLFDDWWLV